MQPNASKGPLNLAGRQLIWCLVWLVLRAPLPLCHAHAAEAVGPGEARLEQHLQSHHAGPRKTPWYDWHVHWVSCWELRRCGVLYDEEDDSTVPPTSEYNADDAFLAAGTSTMQTLEVGRWTFDFFVVPVLRRQSVAVAGDSARPAGGLLGVHRKVGGVRALTGVALC